MIRRTTASGTPARERTGAVVLLALLPVAYPSAARAQEAADGCRVLGLVYDELGVVLSGAWVAATVIGEGTPAASTLTSRNGAFSLELSGCEPVLIEVTLFGYGSASESVDFAGPAAQERQTYSLTRRPIALDPLLVNVGRSSRLDQVGFYGRQAWVDSLRRDYADFYDPRDVVGRARVFHSVPGIVAASRIAFVYRGGDCRAAYYIDGIEFDRRYDFHGWLDHVVKPEEVEGIEIYRAVWGAIPDEYRTWRSNVCGLVLIWTRDRP